LRIGSPLSWTTTSRFDALRLPFRQAQGPELAEGLKALSPSKGAFSGRLGGLRIRLRGLRYSNSSALSVSTPRKRHFPTIPKLLFRRTRAFGFDPEEEEASDNPRSAIRDPRSAI